VDPGARFLDMGFDSIAAVRLRDSLQRATGLSLPVTVFFDGSTPTTLVKRLDKDLAGKPENGAEQPSAAPQGQPQGLLSSMYLHSLRNGTVARYIEGATGLALLRDSFGPADPLPPVPTAVRLSSGPSDLALIASSGLLPGSGPHEFARLAAAFRDVRDIYALPQLGYRQNEPLPCDARAAFGWQVEEIRQRVGSRPFALLGHSAGAVLAHLLGHHLQEAGIHPAAQILIDPYEGDNPEMLAHLGQWIADQAFQGSAGRPPVDDYQVSALVSYTVRVINDWQSVVTSVPTLLVRASYPVSERLAGTAWKARWPFRHHVVETPGNHFDVMTSHATETAAAVEKWLADLPHGDGDHL
jgi:thioesterase domain-containing protein